MASISTNCICTRCQRAKMNMNHRWRGRLHVTYSSIAYVTRLCDVDMTLTVVDVDEKLKNSGMRQ